MHTEAHTNTFVAAANGQFSNTLALGRLQNAVEMGRPCLIISPPGFGQEHLVRQVANKLGWAHAQISMTDQQLTDPSQLRRAITELQQMHPDQKVLLLIRHDFNTSSMNSLTSSQQSYADAVALNRIDAVLPVLCSPLKSHFFAQPRIMNHCTAAPDWVCIEPHELYISMPIGTQKLLNSAPPHLHQSLLGIIRLAESWPEMGALLVAKLRGLGSAQELSEQHDDGLTNNRGEGADLQIPSQALKTTCSELLNNFQLIMSRLGDQLLTQSEQMVLAYLSLFPPNIDPFLPFLQRHIQDIEDTVQYLCQKNVLVYRSAEAPNGTVPLLSFSNIAWRFFAQGYLRRCSAADDINQFLKAQMHAILRHADQCPRESHDYYLALAIEFALSSQDYQQAIDLIVNQAQQSDSTIDQAARIEQAVTWLKFVPQRMINLNPKARVIQSYHRLIVDTPSDQQCCGDPFSGPTTASSEAHTDLPRYPDNAFGPRLGQTAGATTKRLEAHTPKGISLKQVTMPNHSVKPTQAGLILDMQQHIQTGNFLQIKQLALSMVEQALSQQRPELFLHGLSYLWYETQINGDIKAFCAYIEKLLSNQQISTHLNEFRYWLNQLLNFITRPDDSEVTVPDEEISLPKTPHLSSLGQNLTGFMTCYFNSIIAMNHGNPNLATDRLQEATYYGMNLPDSMSQTVFPLWFIEVIALLQQNRIEHALTFIKTTASNKKNGSQKIDNPLLTVLESLVIDEDHIQPQDPLVDIPQSITPYRDQLEALSLLWQHQYKRSARKLLKVLRQRHTLNVCLFPWKWLGPSSWYVLHNFQQSQLGRTPKEKLLEYELKTIENTFGRIYTFDEKFLDLSKREAEILGLVVNGCSNEEISNLLCRSLGTVKLHIHSIYKKLEVSNRINAIKKCQSSGFFSFGV